MRSVVRRPYVFLSNLIDPTGHPTSAGTARAWRLQAGSRRGDTSWDRTSEADPGGGARGRGRGRRVSVRLYINRNF